MSMMPPSYGLGMLQPGTYSDDSRLLGELSLQLSTIQHHNRYLHKGTSSPRHNNSMRITKPRSANHSPCSYSSRLQQGWGRTNSFENQHQPLQVQLPSTTALTQPPTRAPRPLSWHPSSSQFAQPSSSQMFGQPLPQTRYQPPIGQYPSSTYVDTDFYANNQGIPPPSPLVYSGYTSPASAFSPMTLPYTPYDQQLPTQQYFTQASWAVPPEWSPALPVAVSPSDNTVSGSTSSDSWDMHDSRGFLRNSVPSTPDSYFQAPQPKVQSEDTIPYQPLEEEGKDEDEDEGEVLYGMGLYDPPKEPLQSLLCGGLHAGKGLTLEAAWAPPASEDEDDAEDDGQQDN